jgi:hypothetical protein
MMHNLDNTVTSEQQDIIIFLINPFLLGNKLCV